MDLKIEHKEEITVIGFSEVISPEEGYIKCPQFWDKEYSQKYQRLWQTMMPLTPQEKAIVDNGIGMLALCIDQDNCFEYMIAGIYKGGEVPEGFKTITLEESDWAVFTAKGPIPESLQSLNTYVWSEWFPNDGAKLGASDKYSLELYTAGNPRSEDYECGIWIPILKK